jgi:Lar family restriction alleviation protein
VTSLRCGLISVHGRKSIREAGKMTKSKVFQMFEDISSEFGLEVYDCPFCGDATGLRTRWSALEALDTGHGMVWRAACSFCGARGPMEAKEEEAIFAWNRRQP